MTEISENKLLENYSNFKLVGTGGMGEVYQAFDTLHNRTVAIKRFHAPLSQKRVEARERLLREAKVSFELNHPNLASIHEVIDADDHLFIIRPFYEGIALDEKLKDGPLSKKEALKLFLDLCGGLSHAHSKNIVHRDIKPANIFILENGEALLMDFGLAKATSLFSYGLTQTGSIIGTLDYLSPERVKGLDNDHRSDIWALGIVLFELLTGEKPFGKNQEISACILKIITSPTPSLADFGGPEEFEPLIYKTLAKSVDKRYQSITEILNDLEIIKSGKPLIFDSAINLQTDLPTIDISTKSAKTSIPNNLPKSTKVFVGRENELKLIEYYLASDESKLVTVVGSGGNGKTGLALKVAEQQCNSPTFVDGIYFIGLESVNTAIAIPSAIAEAINFDFSGIENPTSQLINHLKAKNTLLVFDNIDHLTKELTIVLDILRECPKVKILCTSRTKLGYDQEWLVYLNGLNTPQTYEQLGLEQAKAYDSIKLFERRARRNKASFALTEQNLTDVIKLCQVVQGSPLGIELAASWIRLLSPDRILKEVQKNFDFLDSHSGSPNQSKHKSMRAVFEYSWKLLEKSQQNCLRSLTVFQGGFTIEAFKAITDGNHRDILDLVDASLLQETNEDFFDLQPLVKQYAQEKTKESEHLKLSSEKKHCEYYLEHVAQFKDLIRGKEQDKYLKNIEGSVENIILAWYWAIHNQYQVNTLPTVTEVLRRFFVEKARFTEAINLFENTLITTYSDDSFQRLNGHIKGHLGCIKLYTNESSSAINLSRDAISNLKELNDYQGMMLPLNTLGATEAEQGNYSAAKNYFKHCVKIARHLSETEEATHLANLAMAEQYSGDYTNAAENYQSALDLARRYRLSNLELNITNNLGHLMLATRRTQSAIQLLNDNLELAREIGSTQILPYTYINLGTAHFQLKEYQNSLNYKLEALTLIESNGREDMKTMIYAEIGKSLLFNKRPIEAAEKIKYSLTLGYESNNIKDSFKALVIWSQYLIFMGQKEQALLILNFVKINNGITEEDEVEADKLLKALGKRYSEEFNQQTHNEAKLLELEPLIQSILNHQIPIPTSNTIDSSQLTTSL